MSSKAVTDKRDSQVLSEEQKQRITNTLVERGATNPCPRCGTKTFVGVEGYFMHYLGTDLANFPIGGQGVPVAVVACTNCGFLSQHALGVLGILDQEVGDG